MILPGVSELFNKVGLPSMEPQVMMGVPILEGFGDGVASTKR